MKINRKFFIDGFSLLEVVVALGIFSILLIMTTITLVQVVKIKMDVEARALVAENLEYTIETMKRHLLSANAALVKCEGSISCTLCSQQENSSGLCDKYKEFVWSGDAITFKHGSESTKLTLSSVKIVGCTFHKVDDYVFIMLKATDAEQKVISTANPVVVQSSVVVRNK